MSDIDTLYARWLSGDLSPSEEEALKASGEWEDLEAIIQAMDKMSLPAFDAESAYQKFKSKGTADKIVRLEAVPTSNEKQRTHVRRLLFLRFTAIAASIAMLIAALYLFQGQEKVQVVADATSNERHKFVDESFAILNDGSSISYDRENWDVERRVELEGEAFFEVEKGNSFLVETSHGIVEVLGTEFNVRAWDKNLYVECYSGKVKVKTSTGAEILTKGQAVNALKEKLQSVEVINHSEPLWRKGISRFYDESLNSVLEELARQYNIEVDAPKWNRSFSGTFSHDNLENALQQICKPLGLSYEISVDQKTVKIASR